MYFKIIGDNSDLGWILSKRPGSIFDRHVDTGRRVKAAFEPDSEQIFSILVINDVSLFTTAMKERNEAAYVRPEPWIVGPYNLRSVAECLRSALHGQNGSKTSFPQEKFEAKRTLAAEVGPYPKFDDFFIQVMESFKIKATPTNSMETCEDMVFETLEPMSVSEFLQKIWVVSMAFTSKYTFNTLVSDEQVDRYIRLTTTWMLDNEHKKFIINRLTHYKKMFADQFASGLAKEDEEGSEDDGHDNQQESKDVERKFTLHQLRHNKLLEDVTDLAKSASPGQAFTVVDVGMSEGKLTTALLEKDENIHLIGVDADERKVSRVKKILRKRKIAKERALALRENIMYPRKWHKEASKADVVIATEVIEHLHINDRINFVRLLMHTGAKVIFITVPNIEYNTVFGMEPGTYRHKDHQIEYTLETLKGEIMHPLSIRYNVELVPIVEPLSYMRTVLARRFTPEEINEAAEGYTSNVPPERLQPTFYVKATLKVDARESYPHETTIYDSLYFPHTNLHIDAKQICEGLLTNPFLGNANNIFYLGPTIAPVDYSPKGDASGVLEHPETALDYFAERGITKIIEQQKMMGSRGYVLCFKVPQVAKDLGFKHAVTVNSRSGRSFFNEGAPELDQIHADLESKMTTDFIILDCEILPWKFKGDSLITKDFQLPGEAALLWRSRFGTTQEKENAEQYLRALSHHTQEGAVTVHPFQILATGNVKYGKDGRPHPHYPFTNIKIGFYEDQMGSYLNVLKKLEGGIIKPVETNWVHTEDSYERKKSIQRWEDFCSRGGEGFVYKPEQLLTFQANGFPNQTAIKVRGKDYLRIIYGIDYLEPELFQKLTERGTRRKRLLAAQEQEISVQILHAFVNGASSDRLRLVAAFMGLEYAVGPTVDKTL